MQLFAACKFSFYPVVSKREISNHLQWPNNFSFGACAFGIYPLGLELSVEATYPLDEATGTVLIFLSGQVQGAILVVLAGVMAQDLSAYEKTIEVTNSN